MLLAVALAVFLLRRRNRKEYGMLAYYGYTISPNQIETGEGFLICRNVPIARTGDMEYLSCELGLPGMNIVRVHRSPEEVFSDEALASFEGKPVTDDHPPELISSETATLYERGHAQNIRHGTGEWDGYVIADLHIHDESLIQAVQNGKREISCGYECEYIDNGDGTYSQKNIRGNHIAVVNRGRAGKRAAILDSDTVKKEQAGKRPERKKMKKNSLFLKLFGQAVKDKSPEEIEQMAMDAAGALEDGDGAGTGSGSVTEPPATDPDKKPVKNSEFLEALDKKIDALLAALDIDPEGKNGKNPDDPEDDPMDAAIKKLEGCGGEGCEDGKCAKVIPAGDQTEIASGMDSAIAAAILKSVRPSVAAIKDEKERKAVADALIACVTAGENSDIAKLIQTAQKNAQKAADRKPEADLDAIQKAYDNMNPHRKENK